MLSLQQEFLISLILLLILILQHSSTPCTYYYTHPTSLPMSFRSNKPVRVFKKGIDVEENRAKRAEQTVELRKNKREESIKNRRKIEGDAGNTTGGGFGAKEGFNNSQEITPAQR